MATVSSELRVNLIEDVTKKSPGVAAAIDKMHREASALQAALAESGASDRLQTRLSRLGASAPQVDAVTKAWREYAAAENLAGHPSERTAAQLVGIKRWEDSTIAAVRAVKKEEAALSKARHDQTLRAQQETVKAEQLAAAEKARIAEQAARDAVRSAERVAAEQVRIAREAARDEARERKRIQREEDRDRAADARRVARDAAREEKARLRAIEREQKEAQRHAERLAHEQARTDNTVAGVVGLYAAGRAEHAAVAVGERYREFDKERRYAKVVMGASDEQMKPLVDQAVHGSANSRYNDVQWLAAQRNLAARGYTRDQVMGFAPTAAQLGQAFDLERMEDGVKLFEGAMLGFKKDVSTTEAARKSAQRTADLEVKTSKISGADAEDLIALYKRGAAPARMAGLTEEQLLAFGGTAKKVNIGGDEAATAFVALTKNLLHPTHEAREAMQASGINFSKYQKVGTVNEEGFADTVASQYGVKLKGAVRAGLHRIFTDPELMKDPAKFTPAVTRLLRRDLYGNDAKSLKSIAGLAARYRDDSMQGVDTQGLLGAIMAGMAKNPALANVIFGSKQGGRIAAALDPEMFGKILDQLRNHADGFAEHVSDERMKGFDGALLKLTNQVAILETSIGRAFDSDGAGGGGLLTGATTAAGKFVQALGEANPRILRAGSEAVLLAGGFAALKSVGFLKGGFGLGKAAGALDISATALDTSAKLLDEAAVKLGATRGGVPSGEHPVGDAPKAAEAGKTAPEWHAPKVSPAEVPKGPFGGGFKSIPKKVMLGGPQAIAEYLAYQAATGTIEQGFDAARDHGLAPKGTPGYDPHKMSDRGLWDTARDLWYHARGKDTPEETAAKKDALTKPAPAAAMPAAVAGDDDPADPGDATIPIAGARAAGGPVAAGRTYLVGERGPELFTAGAGGQITNSQALLAAVQDRGAPSTADVQRLLARSSFNGGVFASDAKTADAISAMTFELARSVDGIARAVDRLDREKFTSGQHGSGGSGGAPALASGVDRAHGGRYGFMHLGVGGTGAEGSRLPDNGELMPRGDGKPDPHSFKGLLFRGESAGDPGIYNYKSGGRYRAGHFDANTMTIGEMMARQKAGHIFAAGKYQMIPSTLAEGVRKLGLKSTDVFNSETQDRLFTDYLAGSKRPAISAFVTGKGDLKAAERAASYEWASVGDPDKLGTVSHYGHDHASISPEQMGAALQKAREKYQALVAKGMSSEQARRSALLDVGEPQNGEPRVADGKAVKEGRSVAEDKPEAEPSDGALRDDAGRAIAMPKGQSFGGHVRGQLALDGKNYDFGSGGNHGASSIPFGDYEITPDAVGAWGKANGALGIANGQIYDKALGRMREGIELHAAHSANMISSGCLAFAKDQFGEVKQHVLKMVREKGHAYLHVGNDGASITSDHDAPALTAKRDNPLGLRKDRKGARTAGDLHDGLHRLGGSTIAPAVDNQHLERTAELLDHIHGRIGAIKHASLDAKKRVGGSGSGQVASLGSRTRGNFSSGGLGIG